MNHDTEKKQCQICKGYLFEDDEIVICPECGAPHHRDCWYSIGHCGVQDKHGTDEQYDKVKRREAENAEGRMCKSCGKTSSDNEAEFCPYCGEPYNGSSSEKEPDFGPGFGHGAGPGGPHVFVNGMNINPNTYGGIPKDSKIEGTKVEHVGKFVGPAAHRYIPRFATLNKHGKGSWNWAAFLSPTAWSFSRKMYANGILYAILSLAAGLCFMPFNVELNKLMVAEQVDYINYTFISQNVDAFSWMSLIMLVVGVVLTFVPRIIYGRMGDWVYRGFALNKVNKIVTSPDTDDIDFSLQRFGGMNLFVALLVFIAERHVPNIIGSFVWNLY